MSQTFPAFSAFSIFSSILKVISISDGNTARPSSVISPNFSNLLTRSLFNSVQFPFLLRGEKRCIFFPSIIRIVLSIQPKHSASSTASKYQKTIQLSKVKAEVGYSADDYFNMVYELITNRSDVNLDDLCGTELEAAETALFKEAIAESIRATMWLGDTDREDKLNTFDGFLKRLTDDIGETENDVKNVSIGASFTTDAADAAEALLKQIWDNASDLLKAFKPQGNLVYLVSSDIYAKYEEELDNVILESAYLAKQNGREGLSFRGIPVIDVQISSYLKELTDLPQSFAILTDRRNLALAVNTADFPGTGKNRFLH